MFEDPLKLSKIIDLFFPFQRIIFSKQAELKIFRKLAVKFHDSFYMSVHRQPFVVPEHTVIRTLAHFIALLARSMAILLR